MRGFAILLLFWLAGEWLVRALSAPVPGQVVGMVLLLAALLRGWIRPAWVREAADLLLSRMMLFFAPVIVGVTAFFPLLAREWLAVTGALVGGTMLALAAAGGAAVLAGRKRRGASQGGREHVGS